MARQAVSNVRAPRIDNLRQRRKFLADDSVIAVVPARYGSSRLPAKALAEIAGVPMVVRVWRQASEAKSVARVIVATDDERIAAAVRAAGGEAIA